MILYVTGDGAAVAAYHDLCSKALACPVPAVRHNGGVHVPASEAMAACWDGMVAHPTTPDLYRYRALNPAHALVDLNRLDAAETAAFQAAWAAAGPLDPSWG